MNTSPDVPAQGNLLGIHASVFVGDFDPPSARTAIESAASAGYDLLEIPLLDPGRVDAAGTRRLLEDNGLRATASMGLAAGADVLSEDPATVARGRDLLARAVDVIHEIGGSHLVGVLYGQLRKHNAPCTPLERANSRDAMAWLAQYAAAANVDIALEVVNRYETNLVNTLGDMDDFLGEVAAVSGTGSRSNSAGIRRLSLHADTYHMNIEENSVSAPWETLGDRIGYVHIGESHRGYLGTGTVDFDAFFSALRTSGYEGIIAFESFSSAIVDPLLSNTLGVWRNLWDDPMDLAVRARNFIARRLARG